MIFEAISNKKGRKKMIENYEKMISILQEQLKEDGTLYDFDRKTYLDDLKIFALGLKKELTNDGIDEECELEKGKVKQKTLD